MIRHSVALAAATLALAFGSARTETKAPAPPPAPASSPSGEDLPVTYRGTVVSMGSPGSSQVRRVEVTIERWSTDDERRSFFAALKKGGQAALLEIIEPIDVGYVRIDSSLAYRLRSAGRGDSAKGRIVRVVTDRPISPGESVNAPRSRDYPFGVIEFTMPPDGKAGEGALVYAAQIAFDESGALSFETLPNTIGPQRLMSVEQQKKKEKKD